MTNLAYDETIDIYVRTNETISCIDIIYTNDSLKYENKTNESFQWINGTPVVLSNANIVPNSEVVFNQTDGVVVGSNNYTIDFDVGSITLTSNFNSRQQFGINYTFSIHSFEINNNHTFKLDQTWQKIQKNVSLLTDFKSTQVNETFNFTMLSGNSNSTLLNHTIINPEIEVINDSSDELIINQDYSINFTDGNFTLLNITFNATELFISYNFTDNLTYAGTVSSGITLTKYIADGYLIDIIKDLIDATLWQMRIDETDSVFFEPRGNVNVGKVLTNGGNFQIAKYDTKKGPEFFNRARIIGAIITRNSTETVTDTNTVFTLPSKPLSPTILHCIVSVELPYTAYCPSLYPAK